MVEENAAVPNNYLSILSRIDQSVVQARWGAAAIDLIPSAVELELELIKAHMTQKPVLRGKVDSRALRV